MVGMIGSTRVSLLYSNALTFTQIKASKTLFIETNKMTRKKQDIKTITHLREATKIENM